MAITVTELNESRDRQSGRNPSVTLLYEVRGTDDDTAAKNALIGEGGSPPTHDGLVRDTYRVKPMRVVAGDPDGSVWEGEVNYVSPEKKNKETPLPVGQTQYSFDTKGGSQHITQSLSTIGNYAPSGKTAPDHKGAIGVTATSVEGCDIVIPEFAFSIRKAIDKDDIDALIPVIFSLTGKVNDDTFHGHAAGECLFLGAEGTSREDENYEVTFYFAGKPNKEDQTIGDITDIDYEGWHYVWILYEPAEDANAKKMAMRPRAVYVEKVYEYGDFSGLGV